MNRFKTHGISKEPVAVHPFIAKLGLVFNSGARKEFYAEHMEMKKETNASLSEEVGSRLKTREHNAQEGYITRGLLVGIGVVTAGVLLLPAMGAAPDVSYPLITLVALVDLMTLSFYIQELAGENRAYSNSRPGNRKLYDALVDEKRAASSIVDPFQKYDQLLRVAEKARTYRYEPLAKECFNEAEAVASSISDPLLRASKIRHIAEMRMRNYS